MSVTIKSAREIELMRTAGKLLEEVHNELAAFVKPGISTLDIDRYGEKLIRERGCIPNFLNYNGYPASICVSVNDEVVHGIPHADHILQEGDIVSLDAGLIYKGYHSDAARTHAVGKISPEAQQLIDVTKQSFFEGIKFAKAGLWSRSGSGRPWNRRASSRRSADSEFPAAPPGNQADARHDARNRAHDQRRYLGGILAG